MRIITENAGKPSLTPRHGQSWPAIWKAVDITFSVIILMMILGYLCWICWPILQNGLSNGDDGYFALAAKAVSSGTGYGIWIGNGQFSPFEPSVGTGPALILPIAALTFIAGPLDWLPGAATLAIFMVQIMLFVIVMSRIAPWPNVLTFTACGLTTLLLCSFLQWPFGVLVGEAVAAAYVLIGLALLGASRGSMGFFLSGLAFGLAFLTKQISLFATAGICAMWLGHSLKVGQVFRSTAIRTSLIAAGFIIPITAFELFKLYMLGLSGYVDITRAIFQTTKSFAVGDGSILNRFEALLAMMRQIYFDPIRAMIVIIVTLAATVVLGRRSKSSCKLMIMMLWGGIVVYVLYYVVASTLWARYLWIAVALGCFAAAAPMLFLTVTLRYVVIAAYGFAFYLGVGHNLAMMHDYHAGLHEAEERQQVLGIIDGHADVPVVSSDWGSFFDLFYLSKKPHGWYFGGQINNIPLIQHTSFFAISHKIYANHSSSLDQDIHNYCERLNNSAIYIAIFQCGSRLWDHYKGS